MFDHQHQLVRESWTKLLPIRDTAAELLYARLFSLYPEMAPLFKGNSKAQGEKIMQALDEIVDSLNNLEPLIEPLKQSGRAHRSYGVKEQDYAKFADCLFWTLKEGLGKSFNTPTQIAWAEAYSRVSAIMIEGANYSDSTKLVEVERLPWLKRILNKALVAKVRS